MNTPGRASELIDWIHGARTLGEKKGLSNMMRMLELLGDPQRRFSVIHVAGTNGKGSVCACIERALRENDHVTGLFTSPYLRRYQERIRINGEEVGDAMFEKLGARLYTVCEALAGEGILPTTFELGTALAFMCFAESGVEVAVVEVGIGGRLDPTNIVSPICCAIASIGLDHEQILGATLPEIAREKAGIIKPNVPVALYPQELPIESIIAEMASLKGAPLLLCDRLPLHVVEQTAHGATFDAQIPEFGAIRAKIRLSGTHQIRNAHLALCALSLAKGRGIRLDTQKVLDGLTKAHWPGRLDWRGEQLLLDGAHNEQGVRALSDFLKQCLPGRRIVLLTAMMKEKRPKDCAAILAPLVQHVVATQVDWPRALPARELAALYAQSGISAEPCECIPDAFARATELAGKDGLVLVSGSLYLVGAIYNLIDA